LKFKKVKCKEILVFELKYFVARMAIVRRSGQQVKIVAQVEVHFINPLEGALACLSELRSQNKRIPKTVIMVSTEAMPALLNLKFTTDQALIEQEEIIRWEMEENLGVFTKTPSIDTLLQYPNFLEGEQWHKLSSYEETHPTVSGMNLSERLKNASIMDSVDLDEILDFLDQWPHSDEASICSWSNNFSENAKNDSYLCAFLGVPRRDIWLNFFDEEGFNLCGTAPWSLSAVSLIDKELTKDENLLYIEEHPGFWVTARLRKGILINVQCFEALEQNIAVAIIEEIEESESSLLTINSLSHSFVDFKNLLKEDLKKVREIKLPLSYQKRNIHAAAHQAWQLPINFKHIVLPTILQSAPVRKRPQTWWLAVGLAALTFYSVLIFSWIKELDEQTTRFSKIETRNKATGRKLEEIQLDAKKVVQLEESIDKTEKYIKELAAKFEHANLLSSDFVVQFCRLLNETSIATVSLKSVSCSREGHFEVEGMALSELGVYELAKEMANKLKLNNSPALTLEKEGSRFKFVISLTPEKGIQ
jgi:hypothetical protein